MTHVAVMASPASDVVAGKQALSDAGRPQKALLRVADEHAMVLRRDGAMEVDDVTDGNQLVRKTPAEGMPLHDGGSAADWAVVVDVNRCGLSRRRGGIR